MGRGNVCTFGPYEGLYFIDNDDLDFYTRHNDEEDVWEIALRRELDYGQLTEEGWLFDEDETGFFWSDTKAEIMDRLIRRFPSLQKSSGWLGRYRSQEILLENNLFYVVVEDNEWSMAVELLQKEDPYMSLEGLQKRHYSTYLKGIRDVLLELFESIGTYKGAWTSGILRRGDV